MVPSRSLGLANTQWLSGFSIADLYSNTLSFEFVFDCRKSVLTSRLVQRLKVHFPVIS